ncbi:3beta-hydroxysteroid-dehydrogenase/decarboxylase isoform 2 [Apostasia shenzhenica]|uniref:Reticulon-like protein n=1 Tax=Apostasia shenzhenica TaxID=1088818 RepID=A0A2I0AJP5_9ASPA|nr:3beta-hydroxysteroid-dehydrogenase/decarboxylase isoform 2 [Apostasia shenzhenica]
MNQAGDLPAVVTVTFGRSSFVGRSLVDELLRNDHFTVRVVDPVPASDSKPYPGHLPQSDRAAYYDVDIRHRSPSLYEPFTGAAVVFHVDPTAAALQSPSVPASEFHRLHLLLVQTTRNVIAACRECGIQRLVYVGSADAVVGGESEVCCWDESVAYPERFADSRNELRAQAEALVLGLNGKNGILTCALRVSNPFGPGDGIMVPSLVEGAKEGWAKFIIGRGDNLWDFTYIENMVHACICAEQALRLKTSLVSGRPFFITNRESILFWDFISNILEGLGYQRPSIHLPAKIVLALAMVSKFFQEKLLSSKTTNPFVTPSTVRSFTGTRTFDCSNAERLLGYLPIVSLEDGINKTIESFSQFASGSSYVDENEIVNPSKAEKVLGDGKVADILLWRDDRRTFTYLLSLFLLHYWFFLSGRTFISSASKLFMLFALVIFVHGILPSSVLGFTIERMPLSSFDVPELPLRKLFSGMASMWNISICILGKVAKGEDWCVFCKVTGFLCLFKLLLLFSFPLLSAIGLICLFTSFIVYEQCEGEIVKLISAVSLTVHKGKELLIGNLPSSITQYVS